MCLDLASVTTRALTWPAQTFGPRAISAVRRAVGAGAPGAFDSPQYRDGGFHNTLPSSMVEPGSQTSMARDLATKGRTGKPAGVVPLVTPSWPEPAADCAATWLGHASVLLEIGGRRVLADPVWSERCSPSATIGPRRSHPVPVALDALPQVDAVLISHDHYDHLDTATIDELGRLQGAVFVVPLGIGAHLRRWGVAQDRIVELDWGQSHDLDGLRLTCTEARHFSGRRRSDNPTLWSSWLVEAGGHSAFFGGDSGYTAAFASVGAALGRPVDLTVLPIGAYDVRWPDVHMDPEEAVQTHLDVGGEVLLPIHWGTFDLAFHPWREPADRVRAAAHERGVRLAQPRPGERFEVGDALPQDIWWVGL